MSPATRVNKDWATKTFYQTVRVLVELPVFTFIKYSREKYTSMAQSLGTEEDEWKKLQGAFLRKWKKVGIMPAEELWTLDKNKRDKYIRDVAAMKKKDPSSFYIFCALRKNAANHEWASASLEMFIALYSEVEEGTDITEITKDLIVNDAPIEFIYLLGKRALSVPSRPPREGVVSVYNTRRKTAGSGTSDSTGPDDLDHDTSDSAGDTEIPAQTKYDKLQMALDELQIPVIPRSELWSDKMTAGDRLDYFTRLQMLSEGLMAAYYILKYRMQDREALGTEITETEQRDFKNEIAQAEAIPEIKRLWNEVLLFDLTRSEKLGRRGKNTVGPKYGEQSATHWCLTCQRAVSLGDGKH